MSISVRDVTYTYSGAKQPALKNADVELREGELTFIAGQSGSGKSTLIRCVNGLIPRRYNAGKLSGSVWMEGRDAARLSLAQISRLVGTVMQDPERQLVSTQVMDDIAFGLENIGLPREEIIARATAAAQRLNIAHVLERKTFSLSGGEKQKVAIAGVMAMNPRAVLLDEPLASLDPASAREAMQAFRALADEGVAVVVVEHRHEVVLAANPQHCIVLADGAVAYDGDAAGFPRGPSPARRAIAPANPNAKILLDLRDVTFAHPNAAPTLRNINLHIRAGDVIALLGANGAGKSTLCRHFIGLHRPASGAVFLGDENTAGMTIAQMARRVGYVFQNPGAMLFAPTLREELAFGPKNLGLPADVVEKNVLHAAQVVGLADRLDDSPFALSHGQQKRVSVACVLAMRVPGITGRVMALDEPTAGQDSANILRLMDELTTREGFEALVFATHDLDLARTYANRAVVMAEGQIVADGEPSAVLSDAALLARCRLV
ncbi:MAG TPA: ABC transporter ATP-binding protein [Thermoflexales bacterium]|nr:ABC transporter ATP-binding protein [Thermoflexales bacterium]HRA00544.1 ABC transporter ATP-binding protein [Thermoflexales bacterium]